MHTHSDLKLLLSEVTTKGNDFFNFSKSNCSLIHVKVRERSLQTAIKRIAVQIFDTIGR